MQLRMRYLYNMNGELEVKEPQSVSLSQHYRLVKGCQHQQTQDTRSTYLRSHLYELSDAAGRVHGTSIDEWAFFRVPNTSTGRLYGSFSRKKGAYYCHHAYRLLVHTSPPPQVPSSF